MNKREDMILACAFALPTTNEEETSQISNGKGLGEADAHSSSFFSNLFHFGPPAAFCSRCARLTAFSYQKIVSEISPFSPRHFNASRSCQHANVSEDEETLHLESICSGRCC